jgi:hypothetical protein
MDADLIIKIIQKRRDAFRDQQTVGNDERAQRARDMADEYDSLMDEIRAKLSK